MRRTKLSIKKYFCSVLICALLLVLLMNLRDSALWTFNRIEAKNSVVTQYKQATFANAFKDPYLAEPHNVSSVLLLTTNSRPLKRVSHSNALNFTNSHNSVAGAAIFGRKMRNSRRKYLQTLKPKLKPWFFKDGGYYPAPSIYSERCQSTNEYPAKLFPDEDPHSDRIINQLMYVPPNYKKIRESGKLKIILLYNGLGPWNIKQGRDIFMRLKCPVDTCEVTSSRERARYADMILYKDHYVPIGISRAVNSKQVTMLYHLESPYHTQNVKIANAINWTSTYRRDSDVTAPYEKWQYYDPSIRQIEQNHNYALNKTKKVAWFVSNCGARNGRLQFAHELQKYIEVDIYGACGNFKCPRSTVDKCFELLDRDYKFYLAFENSNCIDYITEKLFVNALSRNVLPIVMGARPEDYEISSPYRSYIHVDEFNSPKELAEYLHVLDKNDDLYNSYFKWKGTGEFINTYYWCRVCAVLHGEESLRTPRWYSDVNEWWRGSGVCTSNSWRNFKARHEKISDY